MANVDTSSILGYKPIQIENPMNQYAAMSQIQNAQNQNALAQYQLSAAQRTDEAQNVQNKLYAKHYNTKTGQVNESAFLADLAAQGQGALIPKAQTQFAEQKYKENQGKKIVSEIGKLDYELGNSIFNQSKEELKQINPNNPNAPAQFLAWRERQFANPALTDFFKNTGMSKEATDAQIKEAIRTPQGLADTILKSMTTADQFQKILHDKATLAETTRSHKVQEGIAGGHLDLARYNATKPVFSEAAGGFITTPTAQNPTSTIIPLANPEATTKGKVVTQGKNDVSSLATLMGNSYQKLNDLKGITSTGRSNRSNLAASAGSSMMGQFVGGALGTEEQAERDFIKSQRPLLVQAIVKSTGITAGQINSNNELKNLLDAATDPSKGYETNIRTLNELNKRFGLGGDIIALPTTPSKTNSSPNVAKPSLNEIFSSPTKPK